MSILFSVPPILSSSVPYLRALCPSAQKLNTAFTAIQLWITNVLTMRGFHATAHYFITRFYATLCSIGPDTVLTSKLGPLGPSSLLKN